MEELTNDPKTISIIINDLIVADCWDLDCEYIDTSLGITEYDGHGVGGRGILYPLKEEKVLEQLDELYNIKEYDFKQLLDYSYIFYAQEYYNDKYYLNFAGGTTAAPYSFFYQNEEKTEDTIVITVKMTNDEYYEKSLEEYDTYQIIFKNYDGVYKLYSFTKIN